MGSSQTRARTRVPCISRQTLNHCATREAPNCTVLQQLKIWVFEVMQDGAQEGAVERMTWLPVTEQWELKSAVRGEPAGAELRRPDSSEQSCF